MRYRVKRYVVNAHQAARSPFQRSKYLTNLLGALPKFDAVLDYGCGKLRYLQDLLPISKSLTLCDSAIQEMKVQNIQGNQTTIRDYVKRLGPKVRFVTPNSLETDNETYDFVLCSNVLSSIPTIRSRSRVVKGILNKLKPSGFALFCHQFRNTYFRDASLTSGATKHLDGYLIKHGKTATFYGLLRPVDTDTFLKKNGFFVTESFIMKESSYHVVVKRLRGSPFSIRKFQNK